MYSSDIPDNLDLRYECLLITHGSQVVTQEQAFVVGQQDYTRVFKRAPEHDVNLMLAYHEGFLSAMHNS
jgi:hypothetical protein